jgi:hypothetical protein
MWGKKREREKSLRERENERVRERVREREMREREKEKEKESWFKEQYIIKAKLQSNPVSMTIISVFSKRINV